MTTITVDLKSRSYPIFIDENLFQETATYLATHFPKSRIAIVTDENVNKAHGEALRHALQNDHITIEIPAGETSKSFMMLERVIDKLLEQKFERGDVLLGFGGGVVGDLAGFAASIMKRGMNFVQIPTSLLAQVDSSVGGKTGINTKRGKNLVGAFMQPKAVFIDINILKSLPAREFKAGYAEVVKYGLINDKAFFDWLETNHQAVFSNSENGKNALIYAISTACKAKADIVSRDETEQGERALLNLGHTFGHALEADCQYNPTRIIHGEAVSIGMVLAYRFSSKLGLCSIDTANRVENHLKTVGLPTTLREIAGLSNAETLAHLMMQDKKVSRGQLNLILATGIGESFIAKNIDYAKVLAFLNEEATR